jgi:hypothetical protein
VLEGEKKFTHMFIKIAQEKRTLGVGNTRCRETHKINLRSEVNSTGLKYSLVLDLLNFVMKA